MEQFKYAVGPDGNVIKVPLDAPGEGMALQDYIRRMREAEIRVPRAPRMEAYVVNNNIPREPDDPWRAQAVPAFWDADPYDAQEQEPVRKNSVVKEKGMFKATVKDLFDLRNPPTERFGVEIEVEGQNLPRAVKYFQVKEDGSLRGEAYEYVFETALSLKTATLALGCLEKALINSKVDMSFRTSVHAHVNVSMLNKKQLCTFLYLAYLFENALVNFCGSERVGNRFCLRMVDAQDKVYELEQAFQNEGFLIRERERGKYCAINLACLPVFGSVEFRSMRGTTDKKVIKKWLSILDHLFETSLKYESPRAVADAYRFFGDPGLFAANVLGKHFKDLAYPDLEYDLRNNFSLLISLPFEEIKDFI